MHPPRIPHFITWTHPRPFRIDRVAAVLTLAVLTGLGCDENAPTEIRAPSGRTATGVVVETDLAATTPGDISTTAIVLPVNQSVATTAPNPAFRVNQIGSGPDGIFQISFATSTQTALQGLTNGRGWAGFFRITNTANTQPALQAQTNGSGFTVKGLATGTGGGASFQITNASSNQPAVLAQTSGSEAAIKGIASGTGPGGSFEVSNPNDGQPALNVSTVGGGGAGLFVLNNENSHANALEVRSNAQDNNGFANALSVIHSGPCCGSAAQFFSTSALNGAPTLFVSKGGTGVGTALLVRGPLGGATPRAARFVGDVVIEGAFFDFQNGLDGGASIQINNASSRATALEVKTTGAGWALDVTGPSIFRRNVIVEGMLTKGAGSFRIDHPLDPEHKYLQHSFVESPDMMNVYNGNVTLDAEGRATVELPDYFEALNRDFRYQLTAIGAPGPNLYIAEGVQQNHFRIAGGRPYAHVSWQVTGVRQDTYANEHRIRVEEEKPQEEQKQPAAGHLIARR